MAIDITIPRLGWQMEEAVFAGWLKRPGDSVATGEPLFAVESDKVTMEVESLDSGILYLLPGAPEEGAAVRIGQRIGLLLGDGEAAPAALVSVPVTPRARRIAAELGVDPTALQGTGRGGRVREADVRSAAPPAAAVGVLSPDRGAIAARMMESHRNTAPVTLTTRADATALVALRNRWKAKAEPAPSFNDILAKLVAEALRSHPALRGRWENGRIVDTGEAHIGLAVDTPHGLFAPVLRDVAKTPLAELARRSRRLIEAAHARRLRAEDLLGGTFTITNLGHFGIDAFTPILNFPEIAILGIGAIRMEAVVLDNGGLAARERITLSLTFDHRAVDGAPAARFLQALARMIESPPAEVM
jgi:pyruvate dehydrogenase E2 component (dihydrolipoamide acetyltransferase)